MQYIQDLEAVRTTIAAQGWASALIADTRAAADRWISSFDDSPARISGWGHDYVCVRCNSRLLFDIDKPRAHVCSHCGHTNTEDRHNAVWVATYRGRLAADLAGMALLHHLRRDDRLLSFISSTLLFYARHYEEFEVHGGWVAKGRIMWQSLDEAVFAIELLKTVQIMKPLFPASLMRELHERLFRPLALFVAGQPEHLLNIRLWIRSATAIAGLVFGDEELIDLGLEAEGAAREVLARAVTADHLWIEGSMHYHFYALQALTELCHFAAINGRSLGDLPETARRMYLTPISLAYEDLLFPNPNDGWPDIGLASYIHQYELAQKLFPDPSFLRVLRAVLGDPARRNLSTLLFAPDLTAVQQDGHRRGASGADWIAEPAGAAGDTAPIAGAVPDESLHLPAMSFVKLRRGPLSVFFRYGYRTRAHAHFDRMGLEIHRFSPDPSNIGYGSPLHLGWYMTTVAHNTVVVDGTNQANFEPGECLAFDPAGHVHARGRDVYPGVDFERKLSLQEDGVLVDRFVASAAEEHVYDWLFHGRGEFRASGQWAEASLGFGESGYAHLSEVRRLQAGELECRWTLQGRALLLTLPQVAPDAALEVFSFHSVDNPPTSRRSGILIRARARSADFRVRFQLQSGTA